MQTNILCPRKCIVSELLFNEGDIVPGESKVCQLEDVENKD